ncbi:hypothetical protein GCM10009549_30740 [Streptomyces thermoalcalitolerans]|uniref:DUF5753 domain-containing protein n=1 Tax=Streptomyces thermoalcalitolerans TaxID=65605 RepID=A0ABN1NSV4_9ACTN
MSGDTITHVIAPTAETAGAQAGAQRRTPFSLSRAARELGLKRSEFDLAVQLGHIRTLPGEGGGGRRVGRAEIERLRTQEGFPESLRRRVEVVGTRDGAALLEVTAARFTRLARLGLVTPVTFHLNRYRAVVWRYLADELLEFAVAPGSAALLRRPLPEALRSQLDTGLDLRARNWRGRHLGSLLRQAGDPWERAGAVASMLDRLQVSRIVEDPCERAYLNRFRPQPPVHGTPGSPAARLIERITTAQDPDEIEWLRADLARAVQEARTHRPAPRPAPRYAGRHPDRHGHPAEHRNPAEHRHPPVPERPGRPRGPERPQRRAPAQRYARSRRLLGRLFRKDTRTAALSGPGPADGPTTEGGCLHRAEQALLDDRHDQTPLPVVDASAGQPPAARRDR